MWWGAIDWAQRKVAAGGAPVYVYRFDFASAALGGIFGAMHGGEIPFVFDNYALTPVAGDRPENAQVARVMSEAFVRFAADGDPNHPGAARLVPVHARAAGDHGVRRRVPCGGRPAAGDQGALREVLRRIVTPSGNEARDEFAASPNGWSAISAAGWCGSSGRPGGVRPGGSTSSGTASCCRCTSAATGSIRRRRSRLSMSGSSTRCSRSGGSGSPACTDTTTPIRRPTSPTACPGATTSRASPMRRAGRR